MNSPNIPFDDDALDFVIRDEHFTFLIFYVLLVYKLRVSDF